MTLQQLVASRPTTEKLLLLGLHAAGPMGLTSLAAWLGLANSGSLRGAVAALIRDGLVIRDADHRLSLVGAPSSPTSEPQTPSVSAVSSAGSDEVSPTPVPSPQSSPSFASDTAPPNWRPKSARSVAKLLPTTEARDVWDALGRRLGPDAWATWANAALSQHTGQKGKTPLSADGLAGCLNAFVGNNADLAYPLWKAYLKRAAEKESAPELPLVGSLSKAPSRQIIE